MSRDQLLGLWGRYGLKALQGYGLTEVSNFALCMPPSLCDGEFRSIMTEENRPSSGIAIYGNEVEVFKEDNTFGGPREVGEIVIRGWNVMQGYLDSPDSNAYCFRSGWFHSGDFGWWHEIDGQRFFYVVGRIKETIKRRGESVSLLEIDEFLQGRGESGVAAVGFENRWVGEEIGLFVEGDHDADREQRLLEACQELPRVMRPRAVVFGNSVARTPTGKIQRSAMAPAFAAMRDRDLDRD